VRSEERLRASQDKLTATLTATGASRGITHTARLLVLAHQEPGRQMRISFQLPKNMCKRRAL
jgi:hypothetical protein